jgi:ribosomal protein L37AE/L43A
VITLEGTQLMDIYSILSSKPHKPHYLKRYHNFIIYCSSKNDNLDKNVYTEKHHICPKANSLFPEYSSFKEYPKNIIALTGRQHYIAHLILAKAYGGSMWLALDRMTHFSGSHSEHRNFFVSSKIYEKIREEKSVIMSLLRRKEGKWVGEKNPMFGKGKSNPLYGIKRSKETRMLQSEVRKRTAKTLECPKCGLEGDSRMMKAWHFDNCGKMDQNAGNKNGKAKRINIYNSKGELIFECHGNFGSTCGENGIPFKPITNSYRNNGIPIMTSELSKKYAKRNNVEKYIGWYAIEITLL